MPPVTVQPLAMWLSMHLIQHFFSLGTSFSSLCDPNLHLGRPPRLSVRLLPLTGTFRRCFVLYTFSKGADNLPIRTDKMCPNHSYCAACHCSTTRDVALGAFNSKLFSLGTYFSSLCDPKWQLGRHPRLSRRLHPHFSLNNCRGFASPSEHRCSMLRVAGGNCVSNNHCDRYRGTRL